jgi:hypothetical protein
VGVGACPRCGRLWRHFAASATSGTHAAAVHVGFSRRAPAAGFIDLGEVIHHPASLADAPAVSLSEAAKHPRSSTERASMRCRSSRCCCSREPPSLQGKGLIPRVQFFYRGLIRWEKRCGHGYTPRCTLRPLPYLSSNPPSLDTESLKGFLVPWSIGRYPPSTPLAVWQPGASMTVLVPVSVPEYQ